MTDKTLIVKKRAVDIYLREICDDTDKLVSAHISIKGHESYVRKFLDKIKNIKNFNSVQDKKDNLPMIEVRYHEPLPKDGDDV